MMQATLQAQFEPLALMPAPQQMQRQQQQVMYHQPALMPPQHMQPTTQQVPSMQRQLLAWQQQQQQQQRRLPVRQLMQLPYTSHSNPAAQLDMYADDQVRGPQRFALSL